MPLQIYPPYLGSIDEAGSFDIARMQEIREWIHKTIPEGIHGTWSFWYTVEDMLAIGDFWVSSKLTPHQVLNASLKHLRREDPEPCDSAVPSTDRARLTRASLDAISKLRFRDTHRKDAPALARRIAESWSDVYKWFSGMYDGEY